MSDTSNVYEGFKSRMNDRLLKVSAIKGSSIFETKRQQQENLQPIIKMSKRKSKEK